MDIQLQNALTEWRHFEGYLTTEEKLASLHDVQGQLIDFLLLKGEPLTTAPATPTAPIVENHSVAVHWQVRAPTIPMTPPSSQSDQVDTPSGPAEPSSECVHSWLNWMFNTEPVQKISWCQDCGALTVYDRTRVPDAAPTFSTSARGASSRFVENSAEESAKSQSKEYPNEDQLKWLDKGGEIALTTLKEFIEGRLKINRNDFKE